MGKTQTGQSPQQAQQAGMALYHAGAIEVVTEAVSTKGYFGVPMLASGEYTVAGTGAEYTVRYRAEPKRLTCSCPGASKRKERCEHIRAVERLLRDRQSELIRADRAERL